MGKKIILFVTVIISITVTIYFLRFLFVMSWVDNAEIDYKIVPIDVFSILISSILTIWIGWYIAKKLTEQRFEKDFLIKDLSQIESEVHNIENIFNSSGNIDISYIASRNNGIQLLHQRLLKTMELMRFSDIESDELSLKITRLFQVTTNFDAPTVPIENIDIQTITAVCNEVITNVRGLIISINSR